LSASYQRTLSYALAVGQYFQAQDDFLDCYGDAQVMGKVGTDIENGKCSWLIVEALRLANPSQRCELAANYGIEDPARVDVVKQIFDDLKLREAFSAYEKRFSSRLQEETARLDSRLAAVGRQLLQKLFKRST